jgi:hypothetical protein
VKPGDIVFAHSNGIMGKAIRLGEWLRFRKGSQWNHVCVIDRIEDGVAYVLQAEPHGVTTDKTLESVGTFILVTPPKGVNVAKLMFFSHEQVGDRYGWLMILALALDILTPTWFPTFHLASRKKIGWICSVLTAEALRFAGWYHPWPSIYMVTPSQVYEALLQSK